MSQPVPPSGNGVLVGAPHTSAWDFFFMLGITWSLGLRMHFLAKHTLFRPAPLGWFMRACGGIPVDRTHPAGIVDDLVARVRAGEQFYLVIAPEGTRRPGARWKSGFYRIATDAGLPVTLGYIDRTTMTAGLGPTFTPSGDVRADMDLVRAFYRDISGVRPSPRPEPRLAEEDRGDA